MKQRLLFLLILFTSIALAQNLTMQNGTFTRCAPDKFYDSGSESGNYSNNEDYTITICPENDGDSIALDFIEFDTEFNNDFLFIYDGDSVNSSLMGDFTGIFGPDLIIASESNTSGCLTINFVSNDSGNSTGWEADILCGTPCQDFTITTSSVPEAGNSGNVVISPNVSIDFSAVVTFSDNDDNLSYNWDFGDGSSAEGINTSHTYNLPGIYDATFTVTDSNSFNCMVSESITVQVLGENLVVFDDYNSVEELVENVLLGGQCTQVSNIVSSSGLNYGDENGIGYFHSASSLFPFSEGIVLSTGNVLNASGPNNSTSNSGTNAWIGDIDLDNFLGVQSVNATFIEFDFIPVLNEINFEFLMASEEYDGGNFVCTFSDAFAFLLTDAQGNTTNLAVLPGTDTPILITNIHPESGSCPAVNEEYFGGYIPENSPPIGYNGRTVSFTANAQVNIGEQYHIKLVVADDIDRNYDSAVFLKAGSFNVGELCGDIGIINVKAFVDSNANGVLDTGEPDFNKGNFTYEKNNDGIINEVNTNIGNFSIVSTDQNDSYDISFSIYDDYLSCYTLSTPTIDNVSVDNGNIITVNFPITDNSVCEDLGVYLINPSVAPRPGFDFENEIIIENLGSTTIASGTVEFTYDELLVFNSVDNINPNYTFTTTANGFTIDFVNLEPGDNEVISISLNCSASINLGEVVTNSLNYTTSTNDIFTENNSSTLTEVVVGSYDPNDKMESHGSQIIYDDFITTDEYLYYTIRFQNVGTAEAINVRIEDVLDSQLDESTFQMLRSSHDYVVTRTDNNLEWNFENINLPAEQDDAEGSNGYVYFKIKPMAGYGVDDVIPNSAAIYFDFNAPIITNTFTTIFAETLSVNVYEAISFSIYPNPASDSVTIQLKETIENSTIEIFDIQGKKVFNSTITNGLQVNTSELSSGLYFVKLITDEKSEVKKLMIE